MFFQAVHSMTYVVIVFILFVLAQIGFSGCEFFLSAWYLFSHIARKFLFVHIFINLIFRIYVCYLFPFTLDRVNFEESVVEVERVIDDGISVPVNDSSTTVIRSRESIEDERQQYIIVYAIILLVGTIFFISRSVSFFKMCLRISINMHDMLFRGISRARMIFFNRNPSGRILNRFARDINSIDSLLPNILLDVVDVGFSLFCVKNVSDSGGRNCLIISLHLLFFCYTIFAVHPQFRSCADINWHRESMVVNTSWHYDNPILPDALCICEYGP